MATVTRNVASYDNGNVVFQVDYDDATLRIVAVRCVNNSNQSAYGEAVQELEPDAQSQKGRKYGTTFLSNSTTEIPVSTSPSLKLQYTIDGPSGQIDGVTIRTHWPA